ncbi:MAG: NAD(P)H-hydrate dehydratase [Gammaproteobacteria bacterium]|nr:NAD(P)H-hydrate dehydratase [Gammaproteobacteria bacterium]
MSKDLPGKLYRVAQVRELDRLAIDQVGIPGYTLMYRAGEAAFQALRRRWPRARRILVLCGAGNNAGDGYVLARMARTEGLLVTVAALFDPERLEGDAAIAWEAYKTSGGTVEEWRPSMLAAADVVVDAMLGTGLSRELKGKPRELVEYVNESGVDVFALDIPTGLHADSGQPMGAAIAATSTITFVALKLGLFTGEAPCFTGAVVFDDLGIPGKLAEALPVAANRITASHIASLLPRRRRTAHKGDFGNVLVVGGDTGMAGAVRLAAEAALRAGAGRVTVATRPGNIAAVIAGRPELMCHGVETADELQELIDAADVIAIGPGLGQRGWGQRLLTTTLGNDKPMVVDADALNLLARHAQRRDNWVLTPHPGEAGRLLDLRSAEVQQDRLAALAQLLERYGGTVVLKGAGTLIGHRGYPPCISDLGNPGMAAPGVGDVLTGIIVGIAAQTANLVQAAEAAVYVHAAAGDDAARDGERGMLASDLIDRMRKWINPN